MARELLKVNDILLDSASNNYNPNKWLVDRLDSTLYSVDEYHKKCSEQNIPMSVIGFCEYIGCHKDTLYLLARENQTAKEILKRLKQKQELDLYNKGLTEQYNSSFAQFILRNINPNQYNKDSQKAQQQTNIQINCNIPNRDIDQDKVTIDNDSIKVHIQSKLDNLKKTFEK